MASRHRPNATALAAAILSATASVLAASPEPPQAPKRPVEVTTHGDVRVDEYAWLRDKENPETISYLEAENAYVESMMAHTKQLQQTLYDEMLGRIKQTDLSVQYRHGPYYYYSRTVEGLAYSIRCRKRGSLDASEEIWLDENLIAVGREYCRVTSTDIDPEHALLAFALDTTGYETIDVYFRDLRSGEMLPDVIEGTAPWGLTWAADGRTIFYARIDESKRANRIYRHVLGTDSSEDEPVLREDDVKFSISVRRSRSDEWIFISSESSTTSEAWCIDALDPGAAPRRIAPRRQGVRYSAAHKRGADRTAGLNDPRVHYWEPAKWAARLRDRMTGDGLLLLKTNMGAGHGGSSGRYGRLRELAMQYAFIVDRVGVPSSEMEGAAPR